MKWLAHFGFWLLVGAALPGPIVAALAATAILTIALYLTICAGCDRARRRG